MSVRLTVVGGGVTGLAAAWQASAEQDVQVTVLESADRLGGKVRTSVLRTDDGAELRLDEGADAFLARVPDAVELCRELGLADELTQPAVGRAKVYVGGDLHFLPGPTVLGVPLDPAALDAAGLLTAEGVERAAVELQRRGPGPTEDVAIGPFLRERYGDELIDTLVAPLIGGINAGDVEQLSLQAVTPQLADAAAEGDSLSRALARRQQAVSPGPVFHGLRAGTGRLVDALASALGERGVELRTSTRLRSLERAGDGWRLQLEGGEAAEADTIEADTVVLATPAPAAAALLGGPSPDAAAELSAIEHSSVVLVTLVYRAADVPIELDASGFLVPRQAGLLLTAASWGSTKWAHWDDGEHVVLRVSAGRSGDDRTTQLSDEALVRALRDDLGTTMGVQAAPVGVRVSRYPQGFAQYTVGHLDRVARIEAAMARDTPGVVVAGAAYRGVGLPACIRQGRDAASRVLAG